MKFYFTFSRMYNLKQKKKSKTEIYVLCKSEKLTTKSMYISFNLKKRKQNYRNSHENEYYHTLDAAQGMIYGF